MKRFGVSVLDGSATRSRANQAPVCAAWTGAQAARRAPGWSVTRSSRSSPGSMSRVRNRVMRQAR